MTEPADSPSAASASGSGARSGLWGLLAIVIGGVSAAVGAGWYFSTFPPASLVVPIESFEVMSGTAERRDGAIVLQSADAKNQVVLLALVPRFATKSYDTVRWQASGFSRATGGALIWLSTGGTSGQVHIKPLSQLDVISGETSLVGHSGWTGEVDRVGLVVQGPWADTVALRGLQIEPKPQSFSFSESLAATAKIWSTLEPWRGGSINFLGVTGRGERWTPTVVVAVWVLAAMVVLLLLSRRLTRRAQWVWGGAILLAGWWILDLRWQMTLWQNIQSTRNEPALVANVAANEALGRVRPMLPGDSTRIFVISNDPQSYDALRARYHLAPHRVHVGFRGLGELTSLRAGDHILVISTSDRMRFDTQQQQLFTDDLRMSAELVASDDAFGSMFRYLGEGQ